MQSRISSLSKELSELSTFKLLSVIKEMKLEDNWLFFEKGFI